MTKGEAINWLRNLRDDIGKIVHQGLWHYEQALAEIMEMIDEMPSAQQWIPVTERPPEFGRYVIVTTSWACVTKAMYCGNYWEIAGIDYEKSAVIAWMPLPEPYGERKDDE